MREAVSFPKPEEVNIIATRNGELTQIPGTEFRTPLAPFKTKIWVTSSDDTLNDQDVNSHPRNDALYLKTSKDVSCIPLGICRFFSSEPGKYRVIARALDIVEWVDWSEQREVTTLKFRAEMLRGFKYGDGSPYEQDKPEKDETLGILAQVTGNKHTQIVDSTGDPGEAILAPCYSERIVVKFINPLEQSSNFWQSSKS